MARSRTARLAVRSSGGGRRGDNGGAQFVRPLGCTDERQLQRVRRRRARAKYARHAAGCLCYGASRTLSRSRRVALRFFTSYGSRG